MNLRTLAHTMSLASTGLNAAASRMTIFKDKASRDNLDVYWTEYSNAYKMVRMHVTRFLAALNARHAEAEKLYRAARELHNRKEGI